MHHHLVIGLVALGLDRRVLHDHRHPIEGVQHLPQPCDADRVPADLEQQGAEGQLLPKLLVVRRLCLRLTGAAGKGVCPSRRVHLSKAKPDAGQRLTRVALVCLVLTASQADATSYRRPLTGSLTWPAGSLSRSQFMP